MTDRLRSLGTRSIGLVLAGAGAGAMIIAYGVRRWRSARPVAPRATDVLEARAVAALREVEPIGSRPIDVAALREGTLEVSGAVSTEEESKRTVEVLQALPDVHTVVNRLTVGEREIRLAETQRRWREGDPSLRETQWEGMRIGMGRRRQSRATDPGRRDDHVAMLSREMEADAEELDVEDAALDDTGTELSREELERQRARRPPD